MAIPGTVPVGGIFAPTDITDEYPVSDPIYAIDGLRNVASLSERNAIPELRRRAGMLVGVTTGSPEQTYYYKLLPGPWTMGDSDWELVEFGGNEGGLPAKYIYAGEEWIVPLGKQNLVYGDLTIEGILNIQDDVTIINGSVNILSGGSITGPGTLNIVDFYTEAEIDTMLAGLINGTVNHVARFTPDGHHVRNSTIRDDGHTTAINTSPQSNRQLYIESGLDYGVYIEGETPTVYYSETSVTGNQTGFQQLLSSTGGRVRGIDLDIYAKGDGTSCGVYIDIESDAEKADIYGMYMNVNAASKEVSAKGIKLDVGSSLSSNAVAFDANLNAAYNTGILLRKSGAGKFYPLQIDDGGSNLGKILQVIDTSGNMQLVAAPTSSSYVHNDLTGIEGGDAITPHYYHSDQPINTTDDVIFRSLRVRDLMADDAVWDLGYTDKRSLGTFQINNTSEGGIILALKGRGTYSSTLPVSLNDKLLSFSGSGYDGNSWRTSAPAGFIISADENWNPSTQATRIDLYVIKPNSSTNFKIASALSDGTFEFHENITVANDAIVTGNLYVNGTEFISYTEIFEVEDNTILLNKGEIGPGVTKGYAGIEIDRGTLQPYYFVFDENRDAFVLGISGEIGSPGDIDLSSLQAVATREDVPLAGGIAIWNNIDNRFDTSTDWYSATQIDALFSTFTTNHNDLDNIQGGSAGSPDLYYHSNQPINSTDDVTFNSVTTGALYGFSPITVYDVLQYNENKHSSYNDRSLVDKEYVDNAIGGILDYISLNTSYSVTGSEPTGTIFWDSDNECVSISYNSTVLQLGEEMYYPVKNQSGDLIEDGTPVQFAGTDGNSGKLLIENANATHGNPQYLFMGLATHDIDNDEDGKVTHFGKVRHIDTTGALSYGGLETWNDGDILYVDTEHPGYLTNVEPERAKSLHNIQVAAIIHAHTNGTLFVRPMWESKLHGLQDTKITSIANGHYIKWNETNDRFENSDFGVDVVTALADNKIVEKNSNDNVSVTTTLDSVAISEADGMKLFYTVKDSTGNNMRAGEILVVWNDTNYSANESQTTGFGDTSGIEIGINLVTSPGTIEINAIITSGTWNVKIRRELI